MTLVLSLTPSTIVVDYSQPPKMVHFNGVNPLDWVLQVERYFFCYSVSDSLKLSLASIFIEGDAREWFHNNQFRDWDEFVDQLFDHYRNWSHEEPVKRLVALEAENTRVDQVFTDMPATTVSARIDDANPCVVEGGNSATIVDKMFDEIPHDEVVRPLDKSAPVIADGEDAELDKPLKLDSEVTLVHGKNGAVPFHIYVDRWLDTRQRFKVDSGMLPGLTDGCDNGMERLISESKLVGNGIVFSVWDPGASLINKGIFDHIDELGHSEVLLSLFQFRPGEFELGFPFDPGSLFITLPCAERNCAFSVASKSPQHGQFVLSTLWYSCVASLKLWLRNPMDACTWVDTGQPLEASVATYSQAICPFLREPLQSSVRTTLLVSFSTLEDVNIFKSWKIYDAMLPSLLPYIDGHVPTPRSHNFRIGILCSESVFDYWLDRASPLYAYFLGATLFHDLRLHICNGLDNVLLLDFGDFEKMSPGMFQHIIEKFAYHCSNMKLERESYHITAGSYSHHQFSKEPGVLFGANAFRIIGVLLGWLDTGQCAIVAGNDYLCKDIAHLKLLNKFECRIGRDTFPIKLSNTSWIDFPPAWYFQVQTVKLAGDISDNTRSVLVAFCSIDSEQPAWDEAFALIIKQPALKDSQLVVVSCIIINGYDNLTYITVDILHHFGWMESDEKARERKGNDHEALITKWAACRCWSVELPRKIFAAVYQLCNEEEASTWSLMRKEIFQDVYFLVVQLVSLQGFKQTFIISPPIKQRRVPSFHSKSGSSKAIDISLAYYFQSKINNTSVVFDPGGGSFDMLIFKDMDDYSIDEVRMILRGQFLWADTLVGSVSIIFLIGTCPITFVAKDKNTLVHLAAASYNSTHLSTLLSMLNRMALSLLTVVVVVLSSFEELHPTISYDLKSKLHKVFIVGSLFLSSSSYLLEVAACFGLQSIMKELWCLLALKLLLGCPFMKLRQRSKRNKCFSGIHDFKDIYGLTQFGIARIYGERANTTIRDLNLEDKVLNENGSIVMNVNNPLEGLNGILANYLWDPG